MHDVHQLNLSHGLDVGTIETDGGGAFTVRTIEVQEVATGYVVRLRSGRGTEAREISVNLGGKSARWLADQLCGMVDRFTAEHGDD